MMRATTFGHRIQLTFFPRLFPVNCYIVQEEDGLTVVDTALAMSADDIRRQVSALGVPVIRLVLTHAHSDHVGSLDRLHAQWPEAQVLISARDARLLQGDTSLEPGEPPSKIRGGVPSCKTLPTRVLAPGDRIGSLEAIACPGHTPGHMGFLDTRDGFLIAGDAFQTRGGMAVAGTLVPMFPFPGLATWDRETALASARALRSLKPTALAVGHGNVCLNPLDAMDHAILMAQRALRKKAT